MERKILSDMMIRSVISVNTLYSEAGSTRRRTDRENWAVVLKFEGETVYTSGGRHLISDMAHMVVLPRGCSYEWLCTRSGSFAIIEFEAEGSYPHVMHLPITGGERILQAFRELEYRSAMDGPLRQMECIAGTYGILLRMLRASEVGYIPADRYSRIRPALEYIAMHFDRPVTNDELAALTGLSTVHFRKLFTEATGFSPIAYLHRFRINKAREMLTSDYGSITEVAQSLGYANIYCFSRTFRAHTGISPREYARREK